MTTVGNTVTGREHAFVGVAVDGIGTHGTSRTSTGAGGVSGTGVGVHGVSTAGPGVRGDAEHGVGVFGASTTSTGTSGASTSGVGVHGVSVSGDGVFGASETGRGVVGAATTATGVEGVSVSGTGVHARSDQGEAVHAETTSATVAAVAAVNLNAESGAAALYARKEGAAGDAAFLDGNVHITGVCTVEKDIRLTGADLAEQFELVGEVDAGPGDVVVLAGQDEVRVSDRPYDSRVAGVVSGAGGYRPALVLDDRPGPGRRPLALTGKVWCRVEADVEPVRVGDLLTTSAVPGYAMRAVDPRRAFGAVVGKSLGDLPTGRALVPILVTLQ